MIPQNMIIHKGSKKFVVCAREGGVNTTPYFLAVHFALQNTNPVGVQSKNTAEFPPHPPSAVFLRKIEASPAALLVESRTQQKSFLFLLEEKIRRAQNQKCRENFFAGWRVVASAGGLASLVWFRSGVSDKMSSSGTVKAHQNLTFRKLTDFFVGGAERRPSISPRQIHSARRGEPRLAVGQDEVRLPCDFNSVSDLLCPIIV